MYPQAPNGRFPLPISVLPLTGVGRSATILATYVNMALERYGTWRPGRFAVEGNRRAALLGVRHDAGGLRGLESPAISRWSLAGL
jgi:hypothetical protein